MSLVSVQPFIYPYWAPNYTTFASTTVSLTMDATTDRIAVMFQAPKSGTLDRMEFYVSGGTSLGTLWVGFRSVDLTTGFPSTGSYYAYTTLTGYSAGWQVPPYFGAAGGGGGAGGSRHSVTQGDLVAFVISTELATTPNVLIRCHDFDVSSNLSMSAWPRGAVVQTGTAYAVATDTLCCALFYQGDSAPTPIGNAGMIWPASAAGTVNASTAGNRQVGNRFQVPFACRVCGAYIAMDNDAPSISVRLYDSDGVTDLINGGSGYAQDGDVPGGATVALPYQLFFEPVTLQAATWYRLAVENLSATAVVQYTFDIPGASYGSACPGGANWMQTTAVLAKTSLVDDASWTQTATRRVVAGLIIDQINDGLTAA